MKVLIFFICLLALAHTQQPTSPLPGTTPLEVVMAVGQIYPGQIDIVQSKQAIHYLKVDQVQKKYLFIKVNSFDNVKMAIGIYSNETRQIIYACEDNLFDSCYVSTSLLKPNNVYVILIVADDNLKYNLFTYWGDLQHIKPNQQVKFMFDNTNPNQLFHLQFNQVTQFQQIRLVLKPQTTRTKGDNLKIFANIGFKQQPTIQQHQYQSVYIWNDAQAIILNKQQVKNQKGIGIYIVGNAQTVYIFKCQFIKQTSHTVKAGQVVNDYLPRQQSTSYRMSFQQSNIVDSFVIKFSAFTGQIMVQFYYDKQLTKIAQKSAYQYMSDQQYNFDKSDFQKNTTQIYMKVKALDTQATYQITVQARKKQLAYQITQNVYEFTQMNQPKQAMYFYSHIWDNTNYQKLQHYKFDISIIKIFGSPKVNYYYCKADSTQQQCININDPKFQQYASPINPFGLQEIGTKQITTLSVDQSAYKSINNVQKRLMIIIVVYKTSAQPVALALQYSNPNQIRLLRQGRAFQDKVRYQQKRYYKYVNTNPKIQQIRIHINQITGLTKIRAKRTSTFQKQGPTTTIDKDYPDTLIIKQNITQPIYIQVYGVVTSLYTISVSALHTQHLVSNALIMAQDVQYQVKLLPYQHMNIQIHPIQSRLIFEYYVQGGSVMICQVLTNDLCMTQKVFSSHGEFPLDATRSREIRLRIGNYAQSTNEKPSSSSTSSIQNLNTKKDQLLDTSLQHLPQTINKVKLTLIYHSQSSSHCDQRRLNKVYSQNIKSGTCYKFHLPIAADLQIMASRSDLGQTLHIFLLCSKKISPVLVNNRFVIKSSIVQQNCQNSQNQMILQIIISDKYLDNAKQVKMDYSVQYLNDTITLADGVAYVSTGVSNVQGALRTYFYQIIDQDRDVNIVLYNKKGIQRFYAKITSKPDRYALATQADTKITSKNSNYYSNPYIQINASTISQANCGRSCVIIISVYSSQKPGSQIQYSLQVTQNHIYLKQDQIKSDFLPKGSVRFYEYDSKKTEGSLVFVISDNNRKCARSLMSKTPFPTSSNFIVKQNQGTIVYEKQRQGTFYFAVQAKQDCPYTVSVSQGKGKVTKIQYGQYLDIKLEQGQSKWLYTRHVTNSSFKIISLKKHGQTKIYVNSTDLTKQSLDKVQNNQIDVQKFAFKSQYQNTLAIDFTAKQYCFNCYYIICVKALKKTQATIFLGGDNSKIAVSQDKILFDTIQNKNALTFATFYRVSNGKLQVKVHSGKINFEMSYANQKFSKSYAQNKKVYHENYNFTRVQGQWNPLEIRITAQQAPALYSFQLSPQKDNTTIQRKVNPGQHTYMYLAQGNEQCFTGMVTNNKQQIFISADTSQKYTLSNLNLVVKLDDNITQNYQRQAVGNIISIRFKFDTVIMIQPKKYNICVKTQSKNDSLSLYVFQNENINLIHSDTQVLVRQQAKYVLYPRHDVILDLFQCIGTAQIYYSSKLQKIRQKQSHKVDMIGIPGQSHAIRVSQFSTLYVDVLAEMATFLWMPLIQSEERGVGYFKYAIGNLQFSSKFNSIQFKVGGIYRAKQTSTKPVSVKYTLYVANSKQLLQSAVMCEMTPKDNLVYNTISTKVVGDNSTYTLQVTMDKKRITDHFSQNQTLYFNVVADMTLQPPNSKNNEDHQHYRFIYFQQVVPSQVFRQNKLQTMQLTLLIVLAVVSIIGFVLISCVFVRCIVPALGRLKNRVLVEEKEDPKDQSIPVPPSSDRNQIPGVPTGTEEQMNK